MKLTSFFAALFAFFSLIANAQWLPIGNAEYTWGPFNVYNIALFSENGQYEDHQRPLMLSFKYEKPIEGKNFAITLIKEIETLQPDNKETAQWLKEMQSIFPDFTPNDILSFIALNNKGYFILNNTVLNHDFSPEFSEAFINIWLSPKSTFIKLQPQLLGKEKSPHTPQEFKFKQEIEPFDEQDTMPELPPGYFLRNKESS